MQVYQGEEGEMNIEDLIFPQLLTERGIGLVCDYCVMKSGSSVAFTSLGQYALHVVNNHPTYSIYVFDDDMKRYRDELASLRSLFLSC